jgi:hypothetical protein
MADMDHGHEKQDLRFTLLLKVWLSLIVCLALVGAVAKLTLSRLQRGQSPTASGPEDRLMSRQIPPAPRLQQHPITDLHALQQREDSLLLNYQWIDRAHGRVRIPISRAMTLLAERGLPVRK